MHTHTSQSIDFYNLRVFCIPIIRISFALNLVSISRPLFLAIATIFMSLFHLFVCFYHFKANWCCNSIFFIIILLVFVFFLLLFLLLVLMVWIYFAQMLFDRNELEQWLKMCSRLFHVCIHKNRSPIEKSNGNVSIYFFLLSLVFSFTVSISNRSMMAKHTKKSNKRHNIFVRVFNFCFLFRTRFICLFQMLKSKRNVQKAHINEQWHRASSTWNRSRWNETTEWIVEAMERACKHSADWYIIQTQPKQI